MQSTLRLRLLVTTYKYEIDGMGSGKSSLRPHGNIASLPKTVSTLIMLFSKKTLTVVAGLLEGKDPEDALKGFREVVRMEGERGEWCVRIKLF